MEELKTKRDALQAQLTEIGKKIDAFLLLDSPTADQAKEGKELAAQEKSLQAKIAELEGRIAQKEREQVVAQEREAKAHAEEQERIRSSRIVVGTGRKTEADAAVKHDENGRAVSYFEETDESVTLQFSDARDAIRQRSIKQQKRHYASVMKAAGHVPWNEFKSAADFIRSGLSGTGSYKFEERVAKHNEGIRKYATTQGMNESIGSDGGYMVMPEMAAGIIDRMYSNNLWSMTDNYTVSGNTMTFRANSETSRATGSRHGGLRGYWLGEGEAPTKSKPTLREINLKLKKLGVVVYFTDELLEDGGSALQEYTARKAAEEFNFMIGDSLLNGTGVGQPLGIVNAPSLISIAKESGQLAATLQIENIEKMYARFYAPNLPSSVWLHNQDIAPELNLMTLGVGTGGVPVFLPPGGASSAPFGMLKGRPLMPTEFNPTLGTQGDLILADMRQILSISKGGIAQAVSMHVEFLTDQLAVRFIMRLDATPWENSPITPYKGTANTQSSFVALDTRA